MNSVRAAGLTEQMLIPARPVVHLELHTGDRERAGEFYAQACGWQTQRIETPYGGYTGLSIAAGLGGGIVECDAAHSLWLPYVAVPSVEHAIERARSLGARILLEPREGPEGWRSVIATPAGGEIAFWQGKR